MDRPSERTRPRAKNAGPLGRRLRFAIELAVIGGLTALTWFERATVGRTLEALPRADWRWLVAALGLQVLSLMGFARTQRLILRAEGVEVSASWMAATTFAGNAISVSLPLVGPEAATAFTFSRFQKVSGDATRAGWALLVAGLVSSLVWAELLAAGAVFSGNGPALVAGLTLGTVIVVAAVTGPYLLRSTRIQSWITKTVARITQRVLQVTRRPTSDASDQIEQAINRLLSSHISIARWVELVVFSLINWLASAACLAAAILAVRATVPWSSLLLVYVAGSAVGSFNLTPGGLGVVESTLAASLVAAGMRSPAALGSVLIFRLVSFWLVALVGWAIFAALRPSARSANENLTLTSVSSAVPNPPIENAATRETNAPGQSSSTIEINLS